MLGAEMHMRTPVRDRNAYVRARVFVGPTSRTPQVVRGLLCTLETLEDAAQHFCLAYACGRNAYTQTGLTMKIWNMQQLPGMTNSQREILTSMTKVRRGESPSQSAIQARLYWVLCISMTKV